MDWKDALAALGASGALPEGEPEAAAPEQTDGKKPQKAPISVYIDRKKRRGKEATVLEGFECDDDELKEIARQLKQQLGCGGSQRDGEILLQGDVRDKACQLLATLGFKTKRCN